MDPKSYQPMTIYIVALKKLPVKLPNSPPLPLYLAAQSRATNSREDSRIG